MTYIKYQPLELPLCLFHDSIVGGVAEDVPNGAFEGILDPSRGLKLSADNRLENIPYGSIEVPATELLFSCVFQESCESGRPPKLFVPPNVPRLPWELFVFFFFFRFADDILLQL